MIPKKMIIGIVTLVILVSAAVYTNFGAGVDSGARYNYELDLSLARRVTSRGRRMGCNGPSSVTP